MSLNSTKIEWVINPDGTKGKTWNPIFGCYGPGGTKEKPNRCWYCYAEELTHRNLWKCEKCNAFIPHIHPERIFEPLQRKKPTTIFVGSMSDMWGDWVPREWIEAVLDVIRACPQHTFLALTKNRNGYFKWVLPKNLWVGYTLTSSTQWKNYYPIFVNQFISLEPLLEAPDDLLINSYILEYVKCIIIGPLNKAGHGPVTTREMVENVTRIADDAGVTVYYKDALWKKGVMTKAEVLKRQVTPWGG